LWSANEGICVVQCQNRRLHLELERHNANALALPEFGAASDMYFTSRRKAVFVQAHGMTLIDRDSEMVERVPMVPSLTMKIPGFPQAMLTIKRGRGSKASLWDWRSGVVTCG